MSAGAVRQGRVYVEIGADPKKFLSAVAQVNRQITELGSVMVNVGVKLGAMGAAITTPIAAAAAQFADLGSVLRDIQGWAGLASNDIGGLTKAAAELGITIDRKTAVASLQLASNMTKMRLALVGVAVTVGSIVAPEFSQFGAGVASVAKQVSQFLRENRKIITVALSVGSVLVGVGAVLTTVGGALKAFGGNTSFLLGPMVQLVRQSALVAANLSRLAVSFVMMNPVSVALGVAVAGAAAVAIRAAGGFDNARKMIAQAFEGMANAAAEQFPNISKIANLTVTATYDAIAKGDLYGAATILWAGAKAAWTVGSSALMGVLDPWIESVQNAWGRMTTFLANTWDRAFASLATSDWGGYLLGAMDNVVNALVATWDYLVGQIQKGWARVQGFFDKGFNVGAEIERIDRENKSRAKERETLRPGFAGRTGLTDAEKERIRADAERRIGERIAGEEQARIDRRGRTDARAAARPGDIRDAIGELRRAIVDRAAKGDAGKPFVPAPQQIQGPAEVRGTFSAFAARELGRGTKGIAEQQLDILRQIAANTKEQVRVAP